MLTGKHLIGGEWRGAAKFFQAAEEIPGSLPPMRFAEGGEQEADAAARAAESAFAEYASAAPARRAAFLRAVAEELDKRGDDITDVAGRETALPPARLQNERGRTTGQLRMFADLAESGMAGDDRVTAALPDRAPPRPEIRLRHCPVGPVAVFGASNFPLAFSAAGGDVASALAAGCPVVVKGHPAHPGTGELAAQAVSAAAEKCGMPAGVYSLVQGTSPELSRALVAHPLVQAVGFTGSLAVGRALYDVAAGRSHPIPFYAEMGSINPVFLLPDALDSRAPEIATGWTESLMLGAGQFCTNPGIVACIDSRQADDFVKNAAEKISAAKGQVMLTPGIADSFQRGTDKIARSPAMIVAEANGGDAKPVIFEIGAEAWQADESLHEEVFGPAGIVVRCKSPQAMIELAERLDGQLTATLHAGEGDERLGRRLTEILARKAGRLVFNGFPTGVEVCEAMMHGGPYPASTHAGFTSVGALAVRRFLRPVCYQNFPASWLSDGQCPSISESHSAG